MARTLNKYSGQPGNAFSLDGGFIQAMSSSLDVLTIQGHSSQAGDLLNVGTYNAVPLSDANEKFSISSSGATHAMLKQIVAIGSGSTAYTVLSSNSGKAHIVPGFSSGAKITLPALADGLNYDFFIKAVTSSDGLSFVPASSPGSFVQAGTVVGNSIAPASAADLVGGAKFSMVCDGTNWYVQYADAGTTASALLSVGTS